MLVEACVTTMEEARASVEAGAERLEVCSALDQGGLTPALDLVRAIVEQVEVPVFVMIRTRGGPFTVDGAEVVEMARAAEAHRAGGADGLVLGVIDSRRRVDSVALAELMAASGGLPVTFHRAFDEVSDTHAALEVLARAGVARVLSSGGAPSAWEGRERLRTTRRAAADLGLGVVAAGRVRGHNVHRLVQETGVAEVHARASAVADIVGQGVRTTVSGWKSAQANQKAT